jgi:hypothetical protein
MIARGALDTSKEAAYKVEKATTNVASRILGIEREAVLSMVSPPDLDLIPRYDLNGAGAVLVLVLVLVLVSFVLALVLGFVPLF